MSRWQSLGIVSLSFILLLSYQNCSNVSFDKVDSDYESLSSFIPECREAKDFAVEPKLLWDWRSQLVSSPDPHFSSFDQVMAAPVVGDLEGDGSREIVFVTFSLLASDWFKDAPGTASYRVNGALRIVDGATGSTRKSLAAPALAPMSSQTPLLMDIDKDGKSEIFYIHYDLHTLIALSHEGDLRWRFTLPTKIAVTATGVTGADLNKDGIGEVIVGPYVISENPGRTPLLQSTLEAHPAAMHSSLAMPLDPRRPDVTHVVSTQGVYDKVGSKLFSLPAQSIYFAAADLYPEYPGLEIVSTGGQMLYVINGLNGQIIVEQALTQFSEDLSCKGRVGGGPPTIGDFDGDQGNLEIAVATGRHLTLFDRSGQPKYKTVTQDCSSLATGLTSFDLNGDKKPEVLYADEEYFRIFEVINGKLEVIHQLVNPSWTLHEYPVVADITGNAGAELLVVANNAQVAVNYNDVGEDQDRATAESITGLRAFTSQGDKAWMPTRPMWNQHSFHPDLVSDQAEINPMPKVNASFFRRNIFGQKPDQGCLEARM